MARTSRTYEVIEEANTKIKMLVEKYPDVFWAIRPEQISVYGVNNSERTEKSIEKNPTWSALRNIKGVEKAAFQAHQIPIRYIVELYASDWNYWSESVRVLVLTEKLLEITPDPDKKNSPDCVGFNILYDAVGINWNRKDPSLIPNLLIQDVEFNLDLRPGMDIEEGDDI